MFLCPAAFLLVERWQQLSCQRQQCQAAEDAVAALKSVEDHPSCSLVELLIADDGVWQTLHRQWRILVDNEAKWEDLTALLANDGPDRVREELRTVYGLTPDAAMSLTSLVARISSEERVQRTVVAVCNDPHLTVVSTFVGSTQSIFLIRT